jgi:hypothetical protein
VDRNSQVLGDQSLQGSSTPSMGERSRSEALPGSNGGLIAPGTLRPRTIVLHEDAGPFDHVAANMEEEHMSVSGSSDCIQYRLIHSRLCPDSELPPRYDQLKRKRPKATT